MKHSLLLAAVAMAATMGAAEAAAPVLHETKVIEVAASPATVWALIGNFSDLTWVPPVKKSSATNGNTPGSVRTVDLGGPKLVEELKAYDAKTMSYTYAITEDPANVKVLPVTDYTSTLSVKPSGTGSKITWSGNFKRGDQDAKPAPELDDKAATTAIAGVYDAGLGAVKTKTDGKS